MKQITKDQEDLFLHGDRIQAMKEFRWVMGVDLRTARDSIIAIREGRLQLTDVTKKAEPCDHCGGTGWKKSQNRGKVKCNHRGWEFVYQKVRRKGKIVRLRWRCTYCRKELKGRLRETKNQKIVREFKSGMSVVGLARKHGMTSRRIMDVIRKAMR